MTGWMYEDSVFLTIHEIQFSIVHLQMSHSGNITMHVNLNVNGERPPSQPSLHHSMDAADISMVQAIPELSVK